MFSKMILLAALVSTSTFASYESAEKNYGRGAISLAGYRSTIINLVEDGYYFSVIPWMKDFLVKTRKPLDSEMESAFEKILEVTGVKSFESLPEEILRRSQSGNIRYILARRQFSKGKHKEALAELKKISVGNSAYPFVVNMKGTIHSILGNQNEALTQFRDCIRVSENALGKSSGNIQEAQLKINRDYCLAGLARVQFAAGDYKKAELNYLDIAKDSYIWPEILFEEAWTSYYIKNYNRTLGKLVSYKAPVFDFIFKPEVEVLKALTYMKMCLYEDAKKTADGFYDELLKPAKDLRRFILSRGKDYRYFYNLMADHESNKSAPLPIINSILKSVEKDAAYIEMKNSLSQAIGEYQALKKRSRSSMRTNLIKNLKTVLDEFRNTLGSYVRSGLVSKYAELYSAFQGMSYIKLEALAQRKERLYQSDILPGKKRGDVKYIDRNDKQYFWNFNGEFWADELGDYVFALRSEC